jgi:hypothetical protein
MGVVGWRMPKNATAGAIPADNEWERLARHYLRFAREEARDACPIYAALAEAVASSPDRQPLHPKALEKQRLEQVRKRQNLTDVNL